MTTIAMFALAATLSVATPNSAYQGHRPRSVGALPAEVRQIFQHEAEGGSVGDLRKDTFDGKTVFEGEILKDGKTMLLQVDSTGQVIRRGPTHDAPKSNRPFAALGK
jgi:hypothetical protein